MDAGKYNRKIQFWRKPTTQSASGANVAGVPVMEIETWANFKKPDALSSGRSNEAGELVLNTFCRFTIRRRGSFTPSISDYIVMGGDRYTIHQIGDSNDPETSSADVTFYASVQNG